MAYRGYKIVAFTPSGRKRTQSVLVDSLRRFIPLLDEWQIWQNTDSEQEEDRQWLRSLPKIYDWIKVIEPEGELLKPKQLNTGSFYVHTTDPETIYVRFDDDIVFIDDDFFTNLLDFRIDNPEYFLVMANIWNNAVISYIQQHDLGNIPKDKGIVEEPWCMDPVGWQSGEFAVMIQQLLLQHIRKGATADLFFSFSELKNTERFSISCFCFFGRDFAKFGGVVGERIPGRIRWDEEVWLTEIYPIRAQVTNVICGSALVSHYSFFGQRKALEATDILDRFKQLARDKLTGVYYDLLEQPDEAAAKSR